MRIVGQAVEKQIGKSEAREMIFNRGARECSAVLKPSRTKRSKVSHISSVSVMPSTARLQ